MTPKELRATYRQIFTGDDGKVVLEDLAKRFNIHSTSFSKDPHETAFREGQRDVVLFIQSTIEEVNDRVRRAGSGGRGSDNPV
jgi:hypothetical protein